MTRPDHPRDLELLASFAPSVRSIARAVLHDGHVAEDVVQDALLVAIERGAGSARDPRRWFAGVVRNLARRRVRTDVARERREGVAARSDVAPAASDIVIRTETHRRVVAAVLALPEPYRETLLLRYFDEFEPREIAVRQGVPGGTVRSRLTRGIELLRNDLDGGADGDRRSWAMALLPLLHPLVGPDGAKPVAVPARTAARRSTASTATATGALLMAAKSHTVAATVLIALLVSLLGGAMFVLSDARERVPSIHVVADRPVERSRLHATATAERSETDAATDDDTNPPVGRESLSIRGLVLRPDRSPAAGATVRCLAASGQVVEVRCGDDGTYSVRPEALLGGGDAYTITAWDEAGNAAADVAPFLRGSAAADVPTLLLAPAFGVTVRVVDADGGAVSGARVVCREHDRTPLGIGESDTGGVVRFEHLPDCDVAVRAYREGIGRGLVPRVVAGRPSTEVVVRLTRRDVAVRVVDGEGAPVAGVRLFAWHAMTLGHYEPSVVTEPSDPDGRTRVRDVGIDDVFTLRPLAPGAPWPATGDVAALTASRADVPARATDVELVLRDATRVHRPIAADSPAPPPGTRLRLAATGRGPPEPAHLSATAYVGEREVIADIDYVPLDAFAARAFASDGSWCLLEARSTEKPLRFHPPRSVVLRVVDSDGRPVAGLRASAWADEFSHEVLTDDAGLCELRQVPSGAFDLHVTNGFTHGDIHRPESISGEVRIGPNDTAATLRLPEEYEFVVHLLVDGRPGIPPTLRDIATGWGRCFGAVEDPATGTVRLRVRHALTNALAVVARADGYLEARANAHFDESGEIEPVTLNLRSGATFRGRVVPTPDWRTTIELQQWEQGRERWQPYSTSRNVRGVCIMALRPRGDGAVTIDGLPAGRYRLAVPDASVVSEPVDIEPSVLSPECILQLVESLQVTGRIELPSGVAFDRDLVLMVDGNGVRRGARIGRSTEGVALRQDGTFTVAVPAGVGTTLRVLHPELAPDPEYGSVTVRGDENDVVLRLVAGGTAVLRIVSDVDVEQLAAALPIYIFRNADDTEPSDVKVAERSGREWRVGGLPAGRFTLWLDPRERYAPVLLRDVDLVRDGGNPIDVALTRGASITVTISDPAVRAQAASAGVQLRATSASPGARRHTRVCFVRGDEPLTVTGLVPGTYSIDLTIVDDAAALTAQAAVTVEHATQDLTIALEPR